MSKSSNRTGTWITLVILGISAPIVAIYGIHLYMTATATPLHPEPQSVPSVAASEGSRPWAGAVDRGRQVMRAGLVEQNLPGLSVAVGVRGEVVWAEGFGWADLENRVPVMPSTRFRIGTASKALTSAAVGTLVEEGRLKLDEQVQTYVPEFPKKEWPVTLRQLMGHLAGVRTDSGDEGPLFGQHCDRPVDALQAFAERPLLFEPGTRYRYSSYGWILVSAAVETAAGEPFLAVMRKRVFDPLGMRDTATESPTQPVPERATFYFPRYSADPRYGPDPMREIDLSCYAGAGAFLSTPTDLVRFGMAIDAGTLLKPATARLLQASQRLPSGEETGYGLGWDLETVEHAGGQTLVAGHDGDVLGGQVASFVIFPDGLVVAVTSNMSYADTRSLAVSVARAFADQARSPARQ